MSLSPRILSLLLASIVLGASGQLMFKAAALALKPAQLGIVKLLLAVFTTPMILGAFTCFFVSALLWIVAIKNIPLSVAYPMVALSYIIIFVGSALLFHEPISWRHWAGAALIVSGILLIATK